MSKLTIKLGQIVAPGFLPAFRKLRALGLPCAYELALVAGAVEAQHAAYREAHEAAVKRLGEPFEDGERGTPEHRTGFRVTPAHQMTFFQEMAALEAKVVDLPVTEKLKLGRPLPASLCADDLIPLLDLVEP